MIQENGNLITDNSTDDNKDVSIHQFADQGFQRLIELSETTYPGREISNSEYLGWEYIHNPDGVAAIFIGEKDGKIVSQYIVIPRWFSIDNNLFKGSLSFAAHRVRCQLHHRP